MSNSLVKAALKAIPAESLEGPKKLIEELSHHISKADCGYFDGELLATVAETHWELAKKRGTGQANIQIQSCGLSGVGARKTIIDVVSDDMAFIVDSVAAEVNKNNHLIDLMLHPIFYALYDAKGKLVDIADTAKEGYIRQSHIHLQIKDVFSDEALKELESGLHTALEDVYIANRDWRPMLAEMKKAREELANAKTGKPVREVQQYCEFLDYLCDNSFTLLGYREYEFYEKDGELKSRTVKGSSLGLLHDGVRPAYISENDEGLPRAFQEMRRNLPPLLVSKTNRLSTVHRRVPMDAIAVKTYDKSGKVKGEKLFLGLFTSVTYSRSVGDVPYLREKVEEVLELSQFIPGSHDRKALRHILEKYPRDELFQIAPKDMLVIATNILRLQERQRIALFMRRDPFRRYISCLVYVPRERYGTNLRKKISQLLEKELNGVCESFYTSLDDSLFARVMFIVNVRQGDEPSISAEELERKLQEIGQTWPELLSQALAEVYSDESSITAMVVRYGEAFPVAYTSRYRPKQSVFDIEKIEQVLSSEILNLDLYRPEDAEAGQLCLKVYNPGEPLTLSDVMPILKDLGLRALSELPFEIKPHGSDLSVWVHDFRLETPSIREEVVVGDVKKNFEDGFLRIWAGEMENDTLNRLMLSANMDWREVSVLRTYVRYLKQMCYPLSRPYTEKALIENPRIARFVVDLFDALHNPALKEAASTEKAALCLTGIERELEKVASLDQDRILRMVTALVEATLRTNYYQLDEQGQPKTYLAVKFDCSKVPELPAPRPYREIFVYSPRVEAVHLRGDKIARGGLRWSDRHEDFRTEVLGLMKAQMVKNSVIVPMGAKGGFVVKRPTANRQEFQAEGIACYKIFMHGLLDITDNLDGAKVVPPKNVVRRDGDDPYLVVAADKGTASFSDIANGISQEYGFWLGDAFASGGSVGYDHKKMGITARGAWESVKLHFRQLNHNIQEQDFDVVGVGDMGGDVFGNGMLLSRHIRLIGAFNHLHIFCDPNPDAASSFKERERLFKGVMGWNEYDVKKLSAGGRIYDRSEKVLTLTPEIRQRFDIEKEKVTPNELMQAILRARADLLWFGGIGTYVKATTQSHADVGDKANDSLRLNAAQLRVKVIGEGANLGVTQLARIEFSEHGGHINTDFVDNSGGVNSSDIEVNIKILLSDAINNKEHKMDMAARNKLLESMTEDVSTLVLRNNYQQAQAISLAELQAKEKLEIQNEFIRDLEREKGLDRVIEGLPDEETIQQRLRAGKGLTRAELAILVSYAKITFTQDLLASDIPDSADMQDWIINYFPEALQKNFVKEIRRHKLAREIVATSMANSLINRMGPTFLKDERSKTGASSDQIAKAYIIVRDAFSLRDLWDEIEALDNKVPAAVQLRAMREISYMAEYAIAWFLMRLGRNLDIGQEIQNFGKGISLLRDNMNKLVTPGLKESIDLRVRSGENDGLPPALAYRIAIMPVLSSACDIIRVSLEQKADLLATAQTYFQIGERFHMDWLRQQARYLPADDHWAQDATRGLVDQLYNAQAALTVKILSDTGGKAAKGLSLAETWLAENAANVEKLEAVFAELRCAGTVDLPMLVIADQKLRNLAAA
ncbi:MAG: NAD-glutamate dehydrogenase [Alphaproteobacteria bacterium]|nr:NAD-glutamate dehydrogenase [Alphaproteobacteria bacterium]